MTHKPLILLTDLPKSYTIFWLVLGWFLSFLTLGFVFRYNYQVFFCRKHHINRKRLLKYLNQKYYIVKATKFDNEFIISYDYKLIFIVDSLFVHDGKSYEVLISSYNDDTVTSKLIAKIKKHFSNINLYTPNSKYFIPVNNVT